MTRPWWAPVLAVFCSASALFLLARDALLASVRDTEVWLGFELSGWPAVLSAPIHYAIFGIGAWGFWRCRPWVWPWASIYGFYVALSHLVWNQVSPRGGGWPEGLAQFALFCVPATALLWARPPRPPGSSRGQASRQARPLRASAGRRWTRSRT